MIEQARAAGTEQQGALRHRRPHGRKCRLDPAKKRVQLTGRRGGVRAPRRSLIGGDAGEREAGVAAAGNRGNHVLDLVLRLGAAAAAPHLDEKAHRWQRLVLGPGRRKIGDAARRVDEQREFGVRVLPEQRCEPAGRRAAADFVGKQQPPQPAPQHDAGLAQIGDRDAPGACGEQHPRDVGRHRRLDMGGNGRAVRLAEREHRRHIGLERGQVEGEQRQIEMAVRRMPPRRGQIAGGTQARVRRHPLPVGVERDLSAGDRHETSAKT